MLRPRRSLLRFDLACRRSASTTGSRPDVLAEAGGESVAGYASPSRSRAVWYKTRARDTDSSVSRVNSASANCSKQRTSEMTVKRVRAVPHDVVRVQAFPWPVRWPREFRRDLLFESQAVVDLPPVGQRFVWRQGWLVADL